MWDSSVIDRCLSELATSRIVATGVAPGAVLCCAASDGGTWRFGLGAAGRRSVSHPEPVEVTTPFDLASVTKPFVACAAARLVRASRIDFLTPLSDYVPELKGTASDSAPLELLLSHRAGLSAHLPLYAPLLEGRPVDIESAMRAAASARRPECEGAYPEGGFPPLYSDLCFFLAGVMLSRAAGVPLERLVAAEVCEPLGLDVGCAADWFAKDSSFAERVAPTEVVPFRGGEVTGEVHDENAWAMVGRGLAGHAGLFGTAESVARFGTGLIDALEGHRPDFLTPEEAWPLVRPRPAGTLRAGFDGRSAEGSSAGTEFGAESFGHLGFTGTSLWCDPRARVVSVILTNRVNPSRDNIAIRAERPLLNDALFRAACALFSDASITPGGRASE
jgi:CubicO group peptidase (beta-lactamase class C family)